MIVLTNIISISFILLIFYLISKYNRIQKNKIIDKNRDKKYKNNRNKSKNRKKKLELDILTPKYIDEYKDHHRYILTPKYIDEYKDLQYCDIIPENTNEVDDYRIENNQMDIFKKTKLEPQPFNYLYYYKIMNSPNTKFVNKIVTDDPITWKCRNDINRPWYNCNKNLFKK